MADLIERSRTIDALKDMYQAAEEWRQGSDTDITIKARAELCMATIVEMKLRIENLPSAEPERKSGKWIRHLGFSCPWECSECNTFQRDVSWYCPHCGVQMEVQDE